MNTCRGILIVLCIFALTYQNVQAKCYSTTTSSGRKSITWFCCHRPGHRYVGTTCSITSVAMSGPGNHQAQAINPNGRAESAERVEIPDIAEITEVLEKGDKADKVKKAEKAERVGRRNEEMVLPTI